MLDREMKATAQGLLRRAGDSGEVGPQNLCSGEEITFRAGHETTDATAEP